MPIDITAYFEPTSHNFTYLLAKEGKAVIIDSALEFEPKSFRLSTTFIDQVLDDIRSRKLELLGVFDTHVHADHITAAAYIKTLYPAVKIGISENFQTVQRTFSEIFQIDLPKNPVSLVDFSFRNSEEIHLGPFSFQAIATPGHTPTCTCFYFSTDRVLFTGDTLFMPDFGTGRCDFPNGSAAELFDSIQQKLYSLPEETTVYVGHDYSPGGRELKWKTSIIEEKEKNKHINKDTLKKDFIEFRERRDKNLSLPRLLYPSLLYNIFLGDLPSSLDAKNILAKVSDNHKQ